MSRKAPPSKKKAALRFSKILVENWKNFRQAEVPLQRRVFLIGPNASGKSNLLDAFRFLKDLTSPGGGFQKAVGQRGGVSTIRCLAACSKPDIGVKVIVEAEKGSPQWQYQLRFHQDKQSRPLIRREQVVLDGKILLDRPDEDDENDPERLTQTHLEQVNVNQAFRELARFFESGRYLHIVPQLVREPDRSAGRSNDPFGGDFLEQIAKIPERTKKARLRKIQKALEAAVPNFREIELWRDERGTPHLRGNYEHWRPRGAWQTEEQFSDGTLRLVGLLWAVMEGTGTLLLEEPELSLHPGIVRYIPQLFARTQRESGRQIIISTHSPDLLRDEGIGLDEVLLLHPSANGTEIRLASDLAEVPILLESGLTLADALMPRTQPEAVEQLPLFGNP